MNKRNFLKCTVMMTLALGMWGQAFAEDSTVTYELAPIVVTANRVPEKLVDMFANTFEVQKLTCEIPTLSYTMMMYYNKAANSDKTLSMIIDAIGDAFVQQEKSARAQKNSHPINTKRPPPAI